MSRRGNSRPVAPSLRIVESRSKVPDSKVDVQITTAAGSASADSASAPAESADKPNPYHDVQCCEWTRGIDTLMSRYHTDRETITEWVLTDPEQLIAAIWKPDGPLAVDNECRCQMGSANERTQFACAQCKNMRRLIDFRLGGVERGFKIECGESAGTSLIVSSTEVPKPFLAWDERAARRARFYVEQYANLLLCGTPNVSTLRCITGDVFTIRTLIAWMINRLFEDAGLNHIPVIHTAFICRGIGYSLYNLADIGGMAQLRDAKYLADAREPVYRADVTRTIIMQLLVILTELMKINFSHGTPSKAALVFVSDAISYTYDGVVVAGPITVQMGDLWNASATFNDVHFFPQNIQASISLEKHMFVPEITTQRISMAHCSDMGFTERDWEGDDTSVVCPDTMMCPDATTKSMCRPRTIPVYKLNSSTIAVYTAMRHIGFPLYPGSFDFYSFMVSLMMDRAFYLSVKRDEGMYRLWTMMWLKDDLARIESMVEAAQTSPARQGAVVEILHGAWLRCDIIKWMWSLVKMGW